MFPLQTPPMVHSPSRELAPMISHLWHDRVSRADSSTDQDQELSLDIMVSSRRCSVPLRMCIKNHPLLCPLGAPRCPLSWRSIQDLQNVPSWAGDTGPEPCVHIRAGLEASAAMADVLEIITSFVKNGVTFIFTILTVRLKNTWLHWTWHLCRWQKLSFNPSINLPWGHQVLVSNDQPRESVLAKMINGKWFLLPHFRSSAHEGKLLVCLF